MFISNLFVGRCCRTGFLSRPKRLSRTAATQQRISILSHSSNIQDGEHTPSRPVRSPASYTYTDSLHSSRLDGIFIPSETFISRFCHTATIFNPIASFKRSERGTYPVPLRTFILRFRYTVIFLILTRSSNVQDGVHTPPRFGHTPSRSGSWQYRNDSARICQRLCRSKR